ncbi:MAG: DUF4255 domain-containing protein [Nostocales cyanobacterium 94392]|nr:DUF4255 domain-containing protein [Nostocales cyanobacterium 94392]
MSDYKVINAVDETLRNLLWQEMRIDPSISSILGSTDDTRISFEPPFKLIQDTEPDNDYLSLFLYRIVENADMKNRPQELVNGSSLAYPPLCLNLFYLITPLNTSLNGTENGHKLLSKTMQIFYDNSIIKGDALQGEGDEKPEELRIIFNPISMEDITNIWSGFMRPYHLSVSYEVKVIYIDSKRERETELVRRKQIQYQKIN